MESELYNMVYIPKECWNSNRSGMLLGRRVKEEEKKPKAPTPDPLTIVFLGTPWLISLNY
jgi:hypothetical protein